MKKIFTLMIALMSMFAMTNQSKAADLVFNVTVPSPTYECWIVGNFNGWNNNLNKMTKVDDTHYTITLDDSTFGLDNGVQVTAANIKYKYLSGGGDWAYVEKDAAGTELNDRTYATGTTIANPDPAKTTIPGNNGNDVVLKWALTFNPNVAAIPKTVTIDAFVPLDVLQLYIVGTFNGWAVPTDTTKMTLVETTAEGKVYRVSFFSADVNKLQYKFCAGPSWDYQQTSTTNYVYPDVTQSTAVEIVTAFNKYFDPTKTGDIHITATVPAGTQRVWIMGSHLGWSWPKLEEGVKNTDGTFSFVAKSVMAMEYRLYNWNTEWSHPEADDADVTKERPNRVANYPADANISITVSAWRNEAPNAVKKLDADKYSVYTSNSSIVVEGVTTKAELFDISGRNLQTVNAAGTYTSKSLNKGLYIIRIDGATMKVAVK